MSGFSLQILLALWVPLAGVLLALSMEPEEGDDHSR